MLLLTETMFIRFLFSKSLQSYNILNFTVNTDRILLLSSTVLCSFACITVNHVIIRVCKHVQVFCSAPQQPRLYQHQTSAKCSSASLWTHVGCGTVTSSNKWWDTLSSRLKHGCSLTAKQILFDSSWPVILSF